MMKRIDSEGRDITNTPGLWDESDRIIDPANWDWYGTWVLDWLCSDEGWDAFDTWCNAFVAAHTDGEFDDWWDTELIEHCYHNALQPVEDSFVGRVNRLLQDTARPWWWLNRFFYRCWHIRQIYRFEHDPGYINSRRRGVIRLLLEHS